ncbi:N-acetylmuramoyl-L-alanine amidase [Streptomyces orinoci]|uniref:N-acetylmuramoyl-L-alanine amidase n=1 Tax=Streptomyces orinoci TaxID=67339 RepID=A0ABV3K8B6_STRON|nr:peptidoglycan recognition family protein [Streptomyces orinoci]
MRRYAKRLSARLGASVLLSLPGILPASGAPAATVQQAFLDAAAEFQVPPQVLLALSYQTSWWESHTGQPSTSAGYGLLHLTDATAAEAATADAATPGDAAARPPAEPDRARSGDASLHTLDTAAQLLRTPGERLRTEDRENIRGGAALLAQYEQALTGGRPRDPAQWYGAVARYSQAPGRSGAAAFADEVYATMRRGAHRVRSDGQEVRLPADPNAVPDRGQLARLRLAPDAARTDTECPAGAGCRFVPAAAGNYQNTNRTENGIPIDYIVIHDAEGSYSGMIATFQNTAARTSAHYVVRSSDGAVTQMVATKNVAFHSGNYWFNLHSIGIEHEGFAAQGAAWFTPTQYKATASLVRYLAERYHVPLDRQHIIGHDNVPGITREAVGGMHWDPGPYWDWNAFMDLLQAHDDAEPERSTPAVGSVVTIAPPFAGNKQTVRICQRAPKSPKSAKSRRRTTTCSNQTQPANLLFVHTSPGNSAPLFPDPAIHPGESGGSNAIEDWGSSVVAGQQFVVADRQGDWTAIWFSGRKAWFYNPGGKYTRSDGGTARIVRPRPGATAIPVYGSAYPAADSYPKGQPPSAQTALGLYTVPAGQAYVATAPAAEADDYAAKQGTVVVGRKHYYTVQLNHRVALLSADDVEESGKDG